MRIARASSKIMPALRTGAAPLRYSSRLCARMASSVLTRTRLLGSAAGSLSPSVGAPPPARRANAAAAVSPGFPMEALLLLAMQASMAAKRCELALGALKVASRAFRTHSST